MKKLLLTPMLLLLFFKSFAQSPSAVQAYINKYKEVALQQQYAYGIPAPITLAQGILESNAGQSGLTRNANNHFGVKAMGSWHGGVYKAKDDEPGLSSFCVYKSALESYEHHSKVLLGPNYRKCHQYSVYDYRSWAWGLKRGGYATAPNYAQALIGIIERYRLYEINGGQRIPPGKRVRSAIWISDVPAAIPDYSTFTTDALEDVAPDKWEENEGDEDFYVQTMLDKQMVKINGVRCTVLGMRENIKDISERYNVPLENIVKFNDYYDVSDTVKFHSGDIIFLQKKRSKYIHAKDFHNVMEGETLHSISQKFGIRLDKLAKMNGMSRYAVLKLRERIMLK